MKRLLRLFTISWLLIMPTVGLVAQPASAVNVFKACNIDGAARTDVCGETGKSGNPVVKAIEVVIAILSIVIGASAVIVIILSAFKMVRSNGNPQEVATARTGVIYACIGLAIAVLAPVLVGYILSKI